MASQSWLIAIRDAEKICFIQDGKRKVHYKFLDGREMVEEYSLDTNVVLRRAWKVCKKFASQPKWEIEVGDPDPVFAEEMENIGLTESSTAPFVTKRITKTSLEWRIRNLPYPIEMYKVTAEPDEYCITIRTENKKFFKKIMLPDLQRIGLKPEQDKIEFSHKFNTLIITGETFFPQCLSDTESVTEMVKFDFQIKKKVKKIDVLKFLKSMEIYSKYKKPPELILCEKLVFEEINKLKVSKEGDVECKQS